MSQNTEVEKVITLGQQLVALADVLTDDTGTPLDLALDTVSLRVVVDLPPYDRVVVDGEVATKDDAAAGRVSYKWTDDDVLAMREAHDGTPAAEVDDVPIAAIPGHATLAYWWVRTRDGESDRHPGDGLKNKIVLVQDY